MENFIGQFDIQKHLINNLGFWPKLTIQGVIEIIILTYVIYKILGWFKNTKASILLRGIFFICVFYIVALVLKFQVITYIIRNSVEVVGIALVVIFQNEIRNALEHLGRSKWLSNIIPNVNKFTKKSSDNVIQEIAKATFEMSKVKTGALMVIEQNESLESIEKTGILIDGKVSSGLLINIFEKNTPLHDGAVLIVGDVIKAATCYLPLSENMSISKSYGTRHRAALGMSEVSDSQVIVVSEETGNVSFVKDGKITMMNDEKELTQALIGGIYSNVKLDNKNVVSRIKRLLNYEQWTK